ncbi:MAG: HAD-IC family P-type ATPase [Alphaproteobacteria bacterium]|nr:HAD-IC family P-type ATPase [Alphaproteobacteria bacterium]
MGGSDDGAVVWHALSTDAALARLQSSPAGLARDEAARRLSLHGENRLPEPVRPPAWRRFLAQFHNVLIYVLLASAAVTTWLGHAADTGVILGVVLLNAVIGYVQEGKAQRAIDAVRAMLSLHAIALRDGRKGELDAALLVPGDVVFLQAGDKVPADLRLLHGKGLRMDEAALTGESVPVEKSADPVPVEAPLGERGAMAYAGTVVAAGQGSGLVVVTGLRTEIGRVSKLLAETAALETPLIRQIDVMGRWLTVAILGLSAATFAIGTLLRGLPAADMFMAAVAMTVAAIPEGLPAIITIALAIGVERMARRNAIIRRLPAVETLGSVTTICTDKTGTLTRNELTVRAIVTADARFDVTGTGYAPDGALSRDGEAPGARPDPVVTAFLAAGALCNDAALGQSGGTWQVAGDPTEGALLVAAVKAGIDPRALAAAHPRLDEIPFDAAHRFMATLHANGHADGAIHLKGAPEAVLERCARERAASGERPIDRPAWRRAIDEAAARGMRVLAIASKRAAADHRALSMAEARDGFTLLGLAAMIDPPRPEAIAAVADCRRAGIRVAMITGDHAATAQAIGREIGIVEPARGRVLSGAEIDAMDDAALSLAVGSAAVVARADPAHKLRLVAALQASGEVVAMTGDGANDAPALKRADVGVAMGLKGTDAAKEASVMVLADDNFATIAEAVRQGRGVYDNLRKTLMFILPTDLGEALLVSIAVLVGGAMPVTPVQIMWINLVTSVTLSLALIVERPEADVMRRKPRAPGEPLLSGFVLWRIAFVGSLMLAAAFTLFRWKIASGASIELARTMAVNAVVACEAFYLVPARFLLAPGLSRRALKGIGPALLTIALTMAAQVGFTYLPPAQALFDTAALGPGDWIAVLAAGLAVLVLAEAEKAFMRRFNARRGAGRPASG